MSGEQSGKPLPIKSDIGQNHHANSRARARLVGGHRTSPKVVNVSTLPRNSWAAASQDVNRANHVVKVKACLFLAAEVSTYYHEPGTLDRPAELRGPLASRPNCGSRYSAMRSSLRRATLFAAFVRKMPAEACRRRDPVVVAPARSTRPLRYQVHAIPDPLFRRTGDIPHLRRGRSDKRRPTTQRTALSLRGRKSPEVPCPKAP